MLFLSSPPGQPTSWEKYLGRTGLFKMRVLWAKVISGTAPRAGSLRTGKGTLQLPAVIARMQHEQTINRELSGDPLDELPTRGQLRKL